MTDRFNGVNIIRGLHGGIICAIGKTPQLNAIHTEFRLKQNGIEIGEIAYGCHVHAAQLLCRLGTDIQQIGHGQRPYLFPVVVLIDNGHRIGFLHVTAQLGIDLRKRNTDGDGQPDFLTDSAADFFSNFKPGFGHALAVRDGDPVFVHSEGLNGIRVAGIDPAH